MPKHKSLLSATTGVSKPAFAISPQEWTNIESKYGRKLPTKTRELIEEATIKYLWLEQMERNALPLTSAADLVSAAQKSAQRLLKQLNALDPRPIFDPDQSSSATVREVPDKDAKYFIVHLLQSRLRLPRARSFTDHLNLFMRDVEAFTLALSNVQVDVQTSGYQQKGQAFRGWVRNLRGILKNAGLPCGTSRNIDTKPSPFVRLVYEIQGCYPREARQHKNGRSLALAIYAAVRAKSEQI